MKQQVILIVDDQPINISIAVTNLSHLYKIKVATDGLAALKMAEDEKPDLILLDIIMPGMDGYEVAKRLQSNENTSAIPIIFLTAKSDPKSISEGFKYGAVDYIPKPFSKDELLARVANHLKISELQREVSNSNIELTKNKIFLRSVLDYSPYAVVASNREGIVTLFNQAAEKMLGYRADEIIGKKTLEFFHDANEIEQRVSEFSKELNMQVLPGFKVFTIKSDLGLNNSNEWKCITKDGKKINIYLTVSAQKDNKGNIEGYIGIAEDITEKIKSKKLIDDYVKIINENVITSSTDLDGNITFVSEAFCNISGYSKEELIGRNYRDIQHSDMDEGFFQEMWLQIEENKIWSGVIKNVVKNGGFYWAEVTIQPIYNSSGEKIGYTSIKKDITDKILTQESEERLKKLFNHQRNIIVISDGREIKNANNAMCRFFGIEKFEDFTRFYKDISDKFMDIGCYFSLSMVSEGENWIEVLEPLLGDKRIVAMHDVENNPHAFSVSISKLDETQYIISFTDISSTMLEKIELSNKVTRDTLTGALNREFFNQNAKTIIAKCSQKNKLSITMLDIDFFKSINDTYGHNAGDIVLQELTKIIIKSIRREDYLIRWGGEEFLLLMETDSLAAVYKVVEKLRQIIENFIFTSVSKLTCSFGITLYIDNENIIDTIQRADKAMYKAKQNGRNRVESI